MLTTRKNSLPLWVMFLVFTLPVIASWILYRYHDYFHFNKLNHGTLVAKPIDVNYLYANSSTEKKWRIIYVDNGRCDKGCEEVTHQLFQVQKALGKDAERVHLTLVAGAYPQLDKLQNAFLQQTTKDFSVRNKIYLVDPIGNLFMYYSANTNPMNVLKDMKKVLGVSQIG